MYTTEDVYIILAVFKIYCFNNALIVITMANINECENVSSNDDRTDQCTVQDINVQSDDYFSVQGNRQTIPYQTFELDTSRQDVASGPKTCISRSRSIILTGVVIVTFIAVVVVIILFTAKNVDGAWSPWNYWGSCSVSCGYGMKSRNRTCTSPVPQGFGGHCLGQSLENTLCFPGSCTNSSWSDWQNWSDCSVNCGVGFRTRSRTCSNPEPSQLRTNCQGKYFDIESCNKTYCDIDECATLPCLNGYCKNLAHGYECSCFAGFSGLRCETAIDECTSDPCANGTCTNGIGNYSCSCNEGFGGTNCEHLITDCVDILRYNGSKTDGIYTVRTWNRSQLISVYCDMTTDGGGWTVFQNRFDGSVEFYRNFSEYDTGFGNLTTEFWLGLNIIQEIAGQGETDLRIDLEAANGTKAYETFDNFYLSPRPAYTLHLGHVIASLRISSNYSFGAFHNGSDFSTYDHDVDPAIVNCAVKYHGAWWYNNCIEANLNGQYFKPGTNSDRGMIYLSFLYTSSLETSKMMIRRK